MPLNNKALAELNATPQPSPSDETKKMLGEHFSNLQSKTSLAMCLQKVPLRETTSDDLAAIDSVTGSCDNL